VVVEQVSSAVAAVATTNAATDAEVEPVVEVVTVAATLGMASNIAVNALFETVGGPWCHGKLDLGKIMAGEVVAAGFDDSTGACDGWLCVGKIMSSFSSKEIVSSFNN
jgi:hypothetical protein